MIYDRRMRGLVLVSVLAIPAIGHADNFFEAVGGISIPAGDDNWTNLTNSSPKLGLRGGVMHGELGGMLQVDWTPVNLDNTGESFGAGSINTAGDELRFLADLAFQHRVLPKVTITARGGAGLDIAYASYSVVLGTSTTTHSNSDVGIAFELAGGAWFDISPNVQLGAELAIPISYHSAKNQNIGDISFDYTSVNVDLLFGVRLFSR